jgi:hypothetical protein
MFTKPPSGIGMMRCTSKHGREIYMFVTDEAALVENWLEASGIFMEASRAITMVSIPLHGIMVEVKIDSYTGCLINSENMAFNYGRLNVIKPMLGSLLIQDDFNATPLLLTMTLDKNNRWDGKLP